MFAVYVNRAACFTV